MQLGMCRASLGDAPEPVRQAVEQAHDEAVEALAELRQLVAAYTRPCSTTAAWTRPAARIAASAPTACVRVGVRTAARPAVEASPCFVVSGRPSPRGQARRRGHAEVGVGHTGDRLRIVVTDDERCAPPSTRTGRRRRLRAADWPSGRP